MSDLTYLALSAEERAIADSFILDQQGDVALEVDRDFLLEPGNIDLYMLYYFPLDFVTFEPLNYAFFDFMENVREGQARLPAGHGKTTMILRFYAYLFCQEPNISSAYTEKNLPTAMKRSYALMSILENNKRLTDHYGDFKGPQWSTGSFTIKQRTQHSDIPTFSCYGAGGGSLLGIRTNFLVNDDPVTAENYASENERNSLWEWYTKAACTAPYPLPITKKKYQKHHKLVGTVFGLDDLYHRAEKANADNPDYKVLWLPAVNEVTGATLSPRFCYIDKEELAARAATDEFYADLEAKVKDGTVSNLKEWRRKNGSWAFYQRYQNQAIDEEAQMFRPAFFDGGRDDETGIDHVGCKDKERSLGEVDEGWRVATGVDPAGGSGSKDSARFATVTLAADPRDPNIKYLIDLDFADNLPQESDILGRKTQTSVILDHADRYGGRVRIEANACQRGYLGVVRKAARQSGLTVSVQPHYTGKNKIDPEIGIHSMVPMFENGYLRIPWRTAHDQRKCQELVNEFLFLGAYPTSDIVMAFWFAWLDLEAQLKAARHTGQNRVQLPQYLKVNRQVTFGPSWTQAQINRYLGVADTEGEEEEDE